MGFFRQEYLNGLPFPSPEDLPDTGIKPASPVLHVISLLLSHQQSLIQGNTNLKMPTIKLVKILKRLAVSRIDEAMNKSVFSYTASGTID